MKKGQVLEGTIEKVEFPNKGVVTVAEEGKICDRKERDSGTEGKILCE